MKKLREGYTTGSCAVAGAKAGALALLEGLISKTVSIKLVKGERLNIPIKNLEIIGDTAVVTVVKDAGDDIDVTHGHDIIVNLSIVKTPEKKNDVIFSSGIGVGTITKPGLPIPPGEPAINPGPRKMIIDNLKDFFKDDLEFHVEINVPKGEELAKKTLNPHLGIIGGISILGTTGIVKPMSEEAFKVSLVPQLKTTKALGYKAVILTPGNIGLESAVKAGVPRDAIVTTSNFIGYMLENALDIGFENIIIWGHIGKLVKLAGGNFYTHNRISDSRMEILIAHLALAKAPHDLLLKILDEVTAEGAWKVIEENNFEFIKKTIAEDVSKRCEKYLFSEANVGTVLLKNREDLLYINEKAKEIGEKAGWIISQ